MLCELCTIILTILIADIINPILCVGVVYGLGSSRPYLNGALVLFCFFFCYFATGLVFAEAFEITQDFFQFSGTWDYVIEFIAGVLLILIGWSEWRGTGPEPEIELEKENHLTPLDACLLGLKIHLIGLPFALPYLAVIDQILKAELTYTNIFLVLLLYNVLYVLPFALLIPVRLLLGSHSVRIFRLINSALDWLSTKVMPLLFILLGLVLLEDCISYFLGYRLYSWLSLTRGD